jgi:hypothetical protein
MVSEMFVCVCVCVFYFYLFIFTQPCDLLGIYFYIIYLFVSDYLNGRLEVTVVIE